MASDENPILKTVSRVLAPLGEARRGEILTLVQEHMNNCPLLAYLCAEGEPGDVDQKGAPFTHEFRLGQPNPLDPSNTVFGIFHWHVQGCFVVYSIRAEVLEDEGGGVVGLQGVYTRDVIFKPRFASGMVTLDACFNDLQYHLLATPWDDVDDGEPDEPAGKPNGRSAEGSRP